MPLPRRPRRSRRLVYAFNMLPQYVASGQLTEKDLLDFRADTDCGRPKDIFVVAWDYQTHRCYTYHQNIAPGILGIDVLDETEGL